MAQKGTYAAYQALRPIQADFGQIARGAETMAAQYRKEQADAEKLAYDRRQEALKSIAEKEGILFEALADVGSSGYENLDDAQYGITDDIANGNLELFEKMRREGRSIENMTPSERMYYSNSLMGVKALKGANDIIAQRAESLKQGMSSGKLSRYNNLVIDKINNLYNNPGGVINHKVNNKGESIIIRTGPDGRVDTYNIHQLAKGMGLPPEVERFDLPSFVKNQNLAEKWNSSVMGLKQTKEQKFESVKKGVEASIKGVLGTAENPKPEAFSVWADYMPNTELKESFTDEDIKSMEGFLMERVQNSYEEYFQQDYDPQAVSMRNANLRGSGSDEGAFRANISMSLDTSTGQPLTTNQTGQSAVEFNVTRPTKDGPAPLKLEIKGRYTLVDKIFLDTQGNIGYTGRTKVGSTGLSGLPEEIEVGGLIAPTESARQDVYSDISLTQTISNPSEANRLAVAAGFNDAEQLKQYLEGIMRQGGIEPQNFYQSAPRPEGPQPPPAGTQPASTISDEESKRLARERIERIKQNRQSN